MTCRVPSSSNRPPAPLGITGSAKVLVLLMLSALAVPLASCGADGEVGSTTATANSGLTVAPMAFNGRLTIEELILDGQPVPLENRPSLIIDAEFGGLEVRPGCNTRYGSFTLTADGDASFTVVGGTSTDCDVLAAQEAAIDAALRSIEAWESTERGYLFLGPAVSLRTGEASPTADIDE